MIISFTGHRPQDLGGYEDPSPVQLWVAHQLEKLLTELKPEKCISGMAQGVDQWAAQVCNYLKIPWIAAVPFKGQESIWPEESQEAYRELLKTASEIVIVSEGGYTPEKMQLRNEWMVDHSDKLIAVWNGDKGGTANCVRYAELIKKPIIRINPKDFK